MNTLCYAHTNFCMYMQAAWVDVCVNVNVFVIGFVCLYYCSIFNCSYVCVCMCTYVCISVASVVCVSNYYIVKSVI